MKRLVGYAFSVTFSVLLLFLLSLTGNAVRNGSQITAYHGLGVAEASQVEPNAGWQEVGVGSAKDGGISDNNGSSTGPSIAFAPDGVPYVAWTNESSGNSEIYVRRWNGSTWEEVGTGSASGGGISNNGKTSFNASIAFAPDSKPYVAWADNSSLLWQIYVRRWNGTTWEEVGVGSATGGGVSNTGTISYSLRNMLAIAPDGTPYVTWDEDDGNPEIYVRKWNGSAWVEVGAGSDRDPGTLCARIDETIPPN